MRLDEMSNTDELDEYSELGISLADTMEAVNILRYEQEISLNDTAY